MALSGAMSFIILLRGKFMLRFFTSILGALTISLSVSAISQEVIVIENVNVIPMTSEVKIYTPAYTQL